MTTTDAGSLTLEQRFPEAFRQSMLKQFAPLILLVGIIGYLAYAVWFFDLPKIVHEAHWERTGLYLSQWISYDIQPDFALDKPEISPRFPQNSPLGADPKPDWVIKNANGGYTVDVAGPDKAVTFDRTQAAITNGAQSLTIQLGGKAPVVATPLPDWVQIKSDQVIADLGYWGNVRVSADRVKVSKKFLGWANFVFDTDSPFFGKSPTQVASLIAFGPDLKPGVSNLALAGENIWNNSAWQHGDVWIKLLQTVVMAFLGTICGAIVAFPLAFLAARNITHNGLVNQGLKRFFDFMRSVDMLIWALFFTRAFGPGPLSGSAAVFFTEVGTLGKIYSEGLENIDDKQREGIQSTGANAVQVQRFGVMPQVVPVMISQTLYQWESNTRGATIIGAVGAGGIGLKLWEAMRTNSNWANVFYMVLLVLAVVFIFDSISNALRSRLIGRSR
jgi:phosphonate transport system permease protein